MESPNKFIHAKGCLWSVVIGMWQCRQWMNFSITKEIIIPEIVYMATFVENSPFSSTASGIKWTNASPIKAPAEKLIK